MYTQIYYGRVSKTLHWLIAFLVISMLFLGYFMFDIPDKEFRGQVINVHKLIGLSILLLMIFRLFWTYTHPKPAEIPGMVPVWQHIAERSVHYLFYITLLLMPISGWFMSVASGHSPKFYSVTFNLPIEKNEAVANFMENIHNSLAIVLIGLVSLHVLAAFYHFAIKRDKVLQRML